MYILLNKKLLSFNASRLIRDQLVMLRTLSDDTLVTCGEIHYRCRYICLPYESAADVGR